MKVRNLIVFFFCVFGSIAAQNNVIHVSPVGSDSKGVGTIQSPFASLQHAYEKALQYGGMDTLYIRMAGGIYPLKQCFSMCKPLPFPLVVEGMGKVVLSGAIRLHDWKETDEGWWMTHVDGVDVGQLKVEQLYINGQRAVRAQTPDVGEFQVKDCEENVLIRGNGRFPQEAVQKITLSVDALKSLRGMNQEEARQVVANFYHKWDNTFRYISRVVPDSSLIYVKGPGMRPWNAINSSSQVVLENYKAAMTQPGEWYMNSQGDLYYIPRKGEKLQNIEAYAPVIGTLLRIKGNTDYPIKNIYVRNLFFQHAAYVQPLKGEQPEQAAALVPAVVQLDYAENVHFDNCSIRHTGIYGFAFERACRDCSVRHSELTDLGAGGVKIGTTVLPQAKELTRGIVVENNIIQHAGRLFPNAVGVVIFHAANNKILHNEISDLGYSGVSVGWHWGYGDSPSVNNEVAYNHIHHIGWGKLSDMGGIYTLGPSKGTFIHHNVIHDILSRNYGGWGLYTDEGSSDIVFENNLVYACTSGGFHQHYGKNNIIRNNIFAFFRDQQLQFSRVEEHRSFSFTHNIILADCGEMVAGAWMQANLDMHDNLYWDLRTSSPMFLGMTFGGWKKLRDKNARLLDPMFQNPLKGDFHFKKTGNVRKIGFRPFDIDGVGVYGSKEWKKRARLSPMVDKAFREEVKRKYSILSGYYR